MKKATLKIICTLSAIIFCISVNAQCNIQILSIDDTEGIIAGMNYAPKATVKNINSADETFIITMKISNGYESRRQFSLSKNAEITFVFDEVNFIKGNYIFSVTIQSQFDDDTDVNTLSNEVAIIADSLLYKQDQ
ncbi:MAG: hypothetical protein IPP29_11540 [Bacteroidetes bacterium]|nr:hypothetical protein [Bacteroidota bacterium]